MIDYSRCGIDAPIGNISQPIPESSYSKFFKTDTMAGEVPTWNRSQVLRTFHTGGNKTIWTCSLEFQIPDGIGPPVLFYYRLTNFYQNHRQYVKSLDSSQLAGVAESNSTIQNGYCTPLTLDAQKRPYYPCGLIANSLFNDTFSSPLLLDTVNSSSNSQVYVMRNRSIAWDSDAKLYGKTNYKPNEIAVPPNWADRWGPEGYTDAHPPPDLSTDEPFQVWMRTAGLPAFSKLALRNDTLAMMSGRYRVDIDMSMLKVFSHWSLWLMGLRLQCDRLWRYKVDCHLNPDGDGRKESIPGNSLCCRRRLMRSPRGCLHNSTSHQTKVSLQWPGPLTVELTLRLENWAIITI